MRCSRTKLYMAHVGSQIIYRAWNRIKARPIASEWLRRSFFFVLSRGSFPIEKRSPESLVIRANAKSRIKADRTGVSRAERSLAVEIEKDAASRKRKKKRKIIVEKEEWEREGGEREGGNGASNYSREKDRPRY